jgi:hypothetical protein
LKVGCSGGRSSKTSTVIRTANTPSEKALKRSGVALSYAQNGWFDFRFFGDFRGPCGPLPRKAIEIDTPDPRYWNACDDCIGL